MDPLSCPCSKSELEMFTTIPTQLVIENTIPTIIHPIASLTDQKTPLEFFISGSGDHYMDLSSLRLHLQVSIKKKDGNKLEATDKVTPVNYFLNSAFSQVSMWMNDKLISSQVNYPYRAMLETLLFVSKEGHESFLTNALFYKDTAGKFNETDPNKMENKGLVARHNRMKETMDIFGRLHIDLVNQPKLIPNNIDIRIKLERSKDSFALLANEDKYQIFIKKAELQINKVQIAPSAIIGIEKELEKSVIKLPFRSVDVKIFTLSSGVLSTTISNAIIGQMPKRVTIALVANNAFNGNIKLNPFNFHHYNLSYISIMKDSVIIPPNPYTPDFESEMYARSFASLFDETGGYSYGKYPNIKYDEYGGGYSLFVFDLTPDKAASENHTSINTISNLSIILKFKYQLPETVNLLCMTENRLNVEIDASRSIFLEA